MVCLYIVAIIRPRIKYSAPRVKGRKAIDMAKSFKQKAVDSMTLSELEHGRTKLDTDNIIGKELTIDKFDIVDVEAPDDNDSNKRMRYCVLVFKELPDNFYNGGLILTKMIDSWLEDYPTIKECQKAYDDSKEKVKIKAVMSKTNKNNKNLVKIEVL